MKQLAAIFLITLLAACNKPSQSRLHKMYAASEKQFEVCVLRSVECLNKFQYTRDSSYLKRSDEWNTMAVMVYFRMRDINRNLKKKYPDAGINAKVTEVSKKHLKAFEQFQYDLRDIEEKAKKQK